MPGWADFNGGDLYYGFPDLEGRGVKFAHDTHGPVIDPDTQSRQPSEAALAEIIAFRDRRFPLLRGAPLTESRVCQYENSSNGDFLIDFHPRTGQCRAGRRRQSATASSMGRRSGGCAAGACSATAPARTALQPRDQSRNPEARSLT